MLRGIRNFHYGILNEQSLEYARNYADRITKTAQATAAIDELLEEKLLTACKTIALYEDEVDNAFLAELADSLELEELYYYNPAGEILYSNHGRYLGWRSSADHPVENFRLSDADLLVEEIRADTLSGNVFKYAYIRADNGFYQIGISAQKVEQLLHAFRPVTLLQEIEKGAQHIESISFLSNDFIVEESSDINLIGLQLDASELNENNAQREAFARVDALYGRTLYQVYAPVVADGNKIGSLLVTQSLEETDRLVRQTATLGMIAFAIVGLTLLYALYVTYLKKRELLVMANRHSATGLPNRRYLQRKISKTNLPGAAFFLIHIYGLATIDHIYGHRFIEGLFQDLNQHLNKSFDGQYEFFHFADNRLALFLPRETTREELGKLAQEIPHIFKELKALGAAMAIDDFGVGYSSFARLEELDVDIIKIDKSFIDRILIKKHKCLIIGELVAMCHKLGLEVVAEGVEKEEQRQYLREQGCDMMQGFLFSRSLPQDQAMQKLMETT